AFGWLAVLALGLLLPLVPVNAQPQSPSPQDEGRDPRDQQIENLKKVIQALEEQKQADRVNRALQEGAPAQVAEQLARIKKEKAKAEEQQRTALRALRLQGGQLAQNQDPEQRRSQIHHLNVDEASPEVRKAMHAIEEITNMIGVKRQELRGLEEKLRQLHADLEQCRAQ